MEFIYKAREPHHMHKVQFNEHTFFFTDDFLEEDILEREDFKLIYKCVPEEYGSINKWLNSKYSEKLLERLGPLMYSNVTYKNYRKFIIYPKRSLPPFKHLEN